MVTKGYDSNIQITVYISIILLFDKLFFSYFRFYARDSGLLKFRIYAGAVAKTPPAATRRLVAFTFHPNEPFAISVQRTNSEYIVNFHVRHAS